MRSSASGSSRTTRSHRGTPRDALRIAQNFGELAVRVAHGRTWRLPSSPGALGDLCCCSGGCRRRSCGMGTDETEFAAKPVVARAMVARALEAGVPARRITADETYGQYSTFRTWLESRRIGCAHGPCSAASRMPDGGPGRE
ncbi:transposase [Saccharopolyspora spinosa]|uniref:transposase n=1 Tax=Saccharopolyspora spinosa TaxID=60894 RepID=UPI0009FE2E0E